MLLAEYLAAVMLGVVCALISRRATRYLGKTEKRYLIDGALSLAGIIMIFIYQVRTHHWNYLIGTFLIAEQLAGRSVKNPH
jgi:hypothetical protein